MFGISATLVDGVLNVELPKREEAKPKPIPVGTGTPNSLGPGDAVPRAVAPPPLSALGWFQAAAARPPLGRSFHATYGFASVRSAASFVS
jgi:hypothetical protein